VAQCDLDYLLPGSGCAVVFVSEIVVSVTQLLCSQIDEDLSQRSQVRRITVDSSHPDPATRARVH
jgi:hypothetical protein